MLAASAAPSASAAAAPPAGARAAASAAAADDDAGGDPTAGAAPEAQDDPVAVEPPLLDPPPVEIATRPPPLHVEYAQYGVALAAEINLDPGAACPATERFTPCILGSGGGLSVRGGYRSPGPWYFGGAYEFTKLDSENLYRLGIFQQLRAEMRYLPDIGYRTAPYFSAGIGGVVYGNEWGVETGGALIFAGVGVELEVSRGAVIGLSCVYRPVLLAGWKDTANYERETAIAQFVGFEFLLEVRSEFGRR
ncbi:uncharacterized protein SOCE26_024730 [Sorangium cellulosum]|uniref:Outer membrane protein beta-barrel domain-containing protein n=2 Tax=Sorangium cellulosum TaxID=56 RepID=A0A2L0EP45_SORCE|nr:uncharacterized protein SOCE26_024730 [Sorangium cellulosum]